MAVYLICCQFAKSSKDTNDIISTKLLEIGDSLTDVIAPSTWFLDTNRTESGIWNHMGHYFKSPNKIMIVKIPNTWHGNIGNYNKQWVNQRLD